MDYETPAPPAAQNMTVKISRSAVTSSTLGPDMAVNISDLSWVPPLIAAWNLTNSCSSYARFVSTILHRSERDMVDLCAVDVYALHEYVASSLPSTFQKSDKNFTRQHTAIWYLSDCKGSISVIDKMASICHEDESHNTATCFQDMIAFNITAAQQGKGACLVELRSALNVRGNADMAGIGVS